MTNTTTPATPDGLSPCWFCGGEAVYESETPTTGIAHCSDLDCLGHHYPQDEQPGWNHSRSKAEAIAAWNTRALSTPLADNGLIEELRSEHEELLRSQSFDYDFGDDVTERLEAEITRLGERYAALRTPMPVTAEGVERAFAFARAIAEADREGWNDATIDEARAIAALSRSPSQANDAIAEALAWYGEQARLCRLIHSEGDAGRQALAADGGCRAAHALNTSQGEGA